MQDKKATFYDILKDLPLQVTQRIVIQAIRNCPFKEILRLLDSFDEKCLRADSTARVQAKLLMKCIPNMYFSDYASISFKYERYTMDYTPEDNLFKIIDYLIMSESLCVSNLHLLELTNPMSFQVSDAMNILSRWKQSIRNVQIRNVHWLTELLDHFYDGDISNDTLDTQQLQNPNSLFSKIKRISVEKDHFIIILRFYLLGCMPNLKEIVIHMVEISELYKEPVWEIAFSLLQDICIREGEDNVPVVKFACTLSRNIDIYDVAEETARIDIINRLHFKGTIDYPKLQYSGALGMVIPNELTNSSWNKVYNADLDFIRMKAMSLEQAEDYVELLKRFNCIKVLQVFTPNLIVFLNISSLTARFHTFAKVESLALKVDVCSASQLNNALPPSVKYMSLSIKRFEVKEEERWRPPTCLNHVTIIPHVSELTAKVYQDNDSSKHETPIPVGATITGEGVGFFEEPVLMSCDWSGSDTRCINIIIQDGPVWEEREINIGSLPLSIERMEVGGGGYGWYFRIKKLPSEWSSDKVVEIAGPDIESGKVIDKENSILHLKTVSED